MRYVVIHIEDILRRILSLLLTWLGLWFLFGFRPIILRRSCCSRTVVRSGVIAWFFQSRFLLALLFRGFVLLLLLVLIKSGEAVLPDYVAIFLLEVSSELGSSESTRMPCLLRAIISKARDAEIVTRFAGMLRSVEYVILCASISGLK